MNVVHCVSVIAVGSEEKTLIREIDFYRHEDFKIAFTGIEPVTRLLSSLLWAAHRVVPQVIIKQLPTMLFFKLMIMFILLLLLLLLLLLNIMTNLTAAIHRYHFRCINL